MYLAEATRKKVLFIMRSEISLVEILQNFKLHVHTVSADDERSMCKSRLIALRQQKHKSGTELLEIMYKRMNLE